MKNFIIGALATLLVLWAIRSCSDYSEKRMKSRAELVGNELSVKNIGEIPDDAVPVCLDRIYRVRVESHDYLVMLYGGYSGMTHDAECETCKNGDDREKEDTGF